MKTSESTKAILPAMLNVQSQLKSLNKDRANPFANSNYVTLDNILDNLKPILTANNLLLIQNPLTISEENKVRVGVETIIYHKDGEYIYFGEFLLDFEKGSKMNLAQSAGSLTSYAKRYVLTAIFAIDTNEDTDGVIVGQQQQSQPQQNQNYQQQQINHRQPQPNRNYQQQNNYQHQQQPSQDELIEKIDRLFKAIGDMTGWSIGEIINSINGQYKINFEQVNYVEKLAYTSQYHKIIENRIKKQQQQQQQQKQQQQQSGFDWGAVANG